MKDRAWYEKLLSFLMLRNVEVAQTYFTKLNRTYQLVANPKLVSIKTRHTNILTGAIRSR